MLKIDSIENGLVIDHIKAGKSMDIYHYLNLHKLDCSIAILKNVKSRRLARKDIIKIEGCVDIDYNVLGYIDPNITVNVISDGEISSKIQLKLPETITNILKCKNPRCITSIEQELSQVFKLAEAGKAIYRCIYCEEQY